MSKLRINYFEIIGRLKKDGFSDEDANKIIEIFNSFPVIAEINNGLVDVGEKFNIEICNPKMESPKKEDVVFTGWFNLYMDGIDSSKVLSVTLPKLDIRDVKKLELEIELMTTDFRDINDNK